MHRNLIQKTMDLEVLNSEKSIKKCIKNIMIFLHGFFIDFGSILEGLGQGLGALGQLLGFPKAFQILAKTP